MLQSSHLIVLWFQFLCLTLVAKLPFYASIHIPEHLHVKRCLGIYIYILEIEVWTRFLIPQNLNVIGWSFFFIRAEELETALMEMVKQDNRRILTAKVRRLVWQLLLFRYFFHSILVFYFVLQKWKLFTWLFADEKSSATSHAS